MKNKNLSSAGFTMLELLVVLTLVVVLTGLAALSLKGRYGDSVRENYIKDISSYIRYIHYRAIEQGKTHRLDVSSGGQLQSFVDKTGGGRFTGVSDPFIRRLSSGAGYQLRLEKNEGIYFFPNGAVSRNRVFVTRGLEKIAALEVTGRVGTLKVEYGK